eukprot:g5543.t1
MDTTSSPTPPLPPSFPQRICCPVQLITGLSIPCARKELKKWVLEKGLSFPKSTEKNEREKQLILKHRQLIADAAVCAAKLGDIQILQRLLNQRSSIPVDVASSDTKNTPLLSACFFGHYQLCEILVTKWNADIHRRNKYKMSPILAASAFGHTEIVRFLISHGAKLDDCDTFGNTPLMFASMNGHVAVVREIAKHKKLISFDFNEEEEQDEKYDGVGAFQSENVQNSEKKITKTTSSVDLEARNRRGMTALMLAAVYDQYEVVSALLECGAFPDSRDFCGRTALLLVCYSHFASDKTVVALVDGNAEKEARDSKTDTPLIWAARQGREELIPLLLLYGVDVNAKGWKGETALIAASDKCHVEVVRQLVEFEFDNNSKQTLNVEAKNDKGCTALLVASGKGYNDALETITLLLNANARYDAQDNEGNNALMQAIICGNLPLVQRLLDYIGERDGDCIGGPINFENQRNKKGETPLILAARLGRPGITRRLLLSGCNVNAVDEEGRAALMHACRYGHKETARQILEFKMIEEEEEDAVSTSDESEMENINESENGDGASFENRKEENFSNILEQRLKTLMEKEQEKVSSDNTYSNQSPFFHRSAKGKALIEQRKKMRKQ